ncbi:MAG: hypothetical protein IPO48_09115 [Saprospiraceae bacterium]|nr:hypothetical protein [Saprospiraceae bacterium]
MYLSTNFGFVWTPIDFDGFDAESINTINQRLDQIQKSLYQVTEAQLRPL